MKKILVNKASTQKANWIKIKRIKYKNKLKNHLF